MGIFIAAALISLQAGDGHLMGPFGRAIARTVYAFSGVCSYLVALVLGVVAYRLLTDRRPAATEESLGVGLGLLSLAALVHLLGDDYRVAGHPAGGLVGEHLAEVLRAVVSTAGTALFAVTGLVVAVVIATPLRMRQLFAGITFAAISVWSAFAYAGQSCWRNLVRAGRATGRFCGDVVGAILPERDHDEYLEDEDYEDEQYDAYELEEGADPAFVDPPIIEMRSGAVPKAVLEGDTERIDEDELAARLAEASGDDASGADDASKSKSKKSKKKGKKAKKKQADDAEQLGFAAEAMELEPEVVVCDADIIATAPAAAAAGADKPAPMIVESKFMNAGPEEMRKREEAIANERRGFVLHNKDKYELPAISLLDYDESRSNAVDKTAMLELSARLVRTLEHYGVKGEVVAIRPGPVVTMYEFAPAPGTRLAKIVNLTDDLAMALEALRVRIVAPIPGKAVVGIEVPNRTRETVYLKEILADVKFTKSKFKLPLALGKDIEGGPAVVDLAKMPHLLVAGTTGSGKSVAINSMITSLLYNCTPDDVRMIMVDPKMLELSIYEGVPHLLLPVVTDPKKANLALRWAVEEMERRYDLLATLGVRDIATYNKKRAKLQAHYDAERLKLAAAEAARAAADFDQVEVTEERQLDLPALISEPPMRLPYIVVVIDEFADLMMTAAKEVETSVARIAQKARAAGIHLIIATQRPSVDVITGLIKANFPSRAAFHVTSKVDSRTVLDQHGAENLLGAGDMLFSDRGAAPQRYHGCFVDVDEVERVVTHLKQQGRPVYNHEILKPREDEGADIPADEEMDEMYDRAVALVQETRQASISMVQRRLRVGYNRAARMVEYMERDGVVSPPDGTNRREVLLPPAAAAC